MTISLNKIGLSIYIFLYLFNPTQFLSFNLSYVLGMIAITSILLNINNYIYLFKNKYIFTLIVFIVYAVTYLLVIYLYTNEEYALYSAYRYIMIFISLLCALYIVVTYARVFKINFNSFLKLLINVGIIQIAFVLLAIVIPDFRDWTLESSIFENLTSISNDYGGLRSYGLANGYTATFPMLMGFYALFILGVIFKRPQFDRKLLINITIFMLFTLSVILNARIGLVPILIFITLTLLFSIFDIKKFLFIFILSCALTPLIFSTSVLFEYEKYITRLVWGYNEIVSLLKGQTTGTFAALETMLYFPESSLHFWLGSGENVFNNADNLEKNSDIGFVRDIYLFGMINIILITVVLVYFTRPLAKKLKQNFGYSFVITFYLSVFLFYFKGAIFAASEIYNLIVLISVFSIYLKKKDSVFEKNSHH